MVWMGIGWKEGEKDCSVNFWLSVYLRHKCFLRNMARAEGESRRIEIMTLLEE